MRYETEFTPQGSRAFGLREGRNEGTLRDILVTFEQWTGQTINMAKSFLTFSKNMSQAASDSICSTLRIPIASTLGTYLGFPTCLPRSKSLAFVEIKDEVQRKVASWKAKTLSQAGRTVLIQSVATALPSYFMSVFLLPKGLCHSIDSLL